MISMEGMVGMMILVSKEVRVSYWWSMSSWMAKGIRLPFIRKINKKLIYEDKGEFDYFKDNKKEWIF